MVEVEMRDDDVSNVISPKPQLLDLPRRGLAPAQHGSEQMASRAQSARVLNVEAVSGVDKNEATVGFNE